MKQQRGGAARFLVVVLTWMVIKVHSFNAPIPPQGLVTAVVDWAAVKGLQMVAPPDSTNHNKGDTALKYVHLPVSLLPTTFPRDSFTKVIQAAPIFNELVDSISRNRAYLHEALDEVRFFVGFD